jgi:hypothetical protein
MARKQSAGSTAGNTTTQSSHTRKTQVHIIGNIANIIYMSLYYISGVTRLMFIQGEIQDKTKEETAGSLTQVLRKILRENKRSADETTAGPKICSEGGVLR